MKQTLLTMLALVTILTSCSKKDKILPEASFSASKPVYYLTEPASFSNTSSNATSYQWDFGDNTTSTEQSPTHVYQSPGLYTVKLTAGTSTFQKAIKVQNGLYSYQLRNETGVSLPLSSFFYDGNVKDLINHGTVSLNGTTDTVFTNRDVIQIGGVIGGKTFVGIDNYPLAKYANKILLINGSTRIYTGNIPGSSQPDKLQATSSTRTSTTINRIK